MKKITLATIKSFIKREFKNGNLYIKQNSTFDGMVDCVIPVQSSFKKVIEIDFENKYSLGIKGFWLVNQSHDYFTRWSDDNFIGYEVSNCCGISIIAMGRLY